MSTLSLPELAERFHRGSIGLNEFLSLVSFRPDFSLTAEEVSKHEAIANRRRISLYGHIEQAIAQINEKILSAKGEHAEKKLQDQKTLLEKQLEKAKAMVPVIEYDGLRFYKFFRIISEEAKKVIPKPGEKPETHHQRVIAHLAGILPGMIVPK